MSVILRNIQIPLFIKIETGCLGTIRKILDEHYLHFQKPLILSDEHMLKLGGNEVVNAFGQPATILYKENSIAEGQRIAVEMREKGNDVLISIGGGRILDLGKHAATKAQVNYISIPTTPSNDGICSPIAVLWNEEGATESLPVNMPIGIFVDTALLTSAPLKNIRAGVGDLISKFSSMEDWRLAYQEGKEQIDDFAASIASSAAQLLFETWRAGDAELRSLPFLEKLIYGLILSGIAMNIAGSSRPSSGAEHKISHAIDILYPNTSFHGLQVAYGTLFATFLRKQPLEELLRFYRSVGLPTNHTDLGLNEEQMVAVLLRAPATRPDRYTILEKMQLTEEKARQLIHDYHEHLSTIAS